jgi:AraC-like DNA-binding protein
MTTLYLKNMVCNRCIMVVRQELEKLNFPVSAISLGEVVLDKPDISPDELKAIDQSLNPLGFERIDHRKGRMVEAIKNTVIRVIQGPEVNRKLNWSTLLSEELHYEYNYLSNLFSSMEGITLEQYIIRQKIERAKELLFYDELNLSQIAHQLGYSSVAHLSSQFKKVTGLTPTELKRNRNTDKSRKALDEV